MAQEWTRLEQRQDAILRRADAVANKLFALERGLRLCHDDVFMSLPLHSPMHRALRSELLLLGITQHKFVRAPPDYYEWALEKRSKLLGCREDQLCKTIVLENVWCTRADCDVPTNSRFYCLVVQYTAKLQPEMLRSAVRRLQPPGEALPKSAIKFRLAQPEDSLRLTGYEHNAVTPFLLRERVPIILSQALASHPAGFFWLGGGETDLKVGLDCEQFIAAVQPFVLECTTER